MRLASGNSLPSAMFDIASFWEQLPVSSQRNLNNWVMHPVARVSIKYWKTSVRNTVFFSARFYCAYGGLPIFEKEICFLEPDNILVRSCCVSC
jgi:hypothetical protein